MLVCSLEEAWLGTSSKQKAYTGSFPLSVIHIAHLHFGEHARHSHTLSAEIYISVMRLVEHKSLLLLANAAVNEFHFAGPLDCFVDRHYS